MLERLTENRNIVLLDLEWNQGTYFSNYRIPHEIIEIGACRLDADGRISETFSRIIKPSVYKKIDKHIQNVTGITQEELKNGEPFQQVWDDFRNWCGDCRLMTWGRDDYPVLKRNMEFYHLPIHFEPPLDAQLLFGFLFYHDETRQFNLHSALEEMKIECEIPAHRAVYDAEATSLILPFIQEKLEQLDGEQFEALSRILQKERRVADSKVVTIPTRYTLNSDAIKDSRYMRVYCPVCGTRTKFSVPWFDSGKEKFESLTVCREHGPILGTMHLKRDSAGRIIINERLTLAVEEQIHSVKNKYHAFKLIPENKRHHRLEMNMTEKAEEMPDSEGVTADTGNTEIGKD